MIRASGTAASEDGWQQARSDLALPQIVGEDDAAGESLGDVPGPEAMAALRGLNLLMIPVGGVFTINGERAAELLRGLAPSIAVPMHCRTADCNIPIDPVAEFTARFDGAVREIYERPLKISRGSLPAETEAWLLGYK